MHRNETSEDQVASHQQRLKHAQRAGFRAHQLARGFTHHIQSRGIPRLAAVGWAPLSLAILRGRRLPKLETKVEGTFYGLSTMRR